MSPSRPFILRPVATSLLMAAILLVGIVAYIQLPISALPEVDYPTIQISATLPGASPETMGAAVAGIEWPRSFWELAAGDFYRINVLAADGVADAGDVGRFSRDALGDLPLERTGRTPRRARL